MAQPRRARRRAETGRTSNCAAARESTSAQPQPATGTLRSPSEGRASASGGRTAETKGRPPAAPRRGSARGSSAVCGLAPAAESRLLTAAHELAAACLACSTSNSLRIMTAS